MENSKIEWTHHTFNPWIGCTKVSPGCANCYAETLMDTRYGRVKWGKGNPRSRTATANWSKPRQWNRAAEEATERPRVFCASLADWLDDEVPIEWLSDLLCLINETPNLDWLLLTKRPQNFVSRVSAATGWDADNLECPPNVWVGTSAEDQARWDERIPLLMKIPAQVRFVSAEPLIGPIQMGEDLPDWLIVGGESGSGARKMEWSWAWDLADSCARNSVPFFFKQWGQFDSRGQPIGKKNAGRILDGRTWDQLPGQYSN